MFVSISVGSVSESHTLLFNGSYRDCLQPNYFASHEAAYLDNNEACKCLLENVRLLHAVVFDMHVQDHYLVH